MEKPTVSCSIPEIPGPWVLKGDVTCFVGYTPSAKSATLAPWTYHELEAGTSFAAPAKTGKFVGSFGMFMLVSYRSSPAGPYDELLYAPGNFEYPLEEKNGKVRIKRGMRITHIYVSQEVTCYNGRKNWNIPKHLAKFIWDRNPDGSTTLQVFPQDDHTQPVAADATPLFACTLQPVLRALTFPFDSKYADPFQAILGLVAPPVPHGDGVYDELTGTEEWSAIVPRLRSPRCRLVKMALHDGIEAFFGNAKTGFWPKFGLHMMDVTLDFPIGEHWTTPANLPKSFTQ